MGGCYSKGRYTMDEDELKAKKDKKNKGKADKKPETNAAKAVKADDVKVEVKKEESNSTEANKGASEKSNDVIVPETVVEVKTTGSAPKESDTKDTPEIRKEEDETKQEDLDKDSKEDDQIVAGEKQTTGMVLVSEGEHTQATVTRTVFSTQTTVRTVIIDGEETNAESVTSEEKHTTTEETTLINGTPEVDTEAETENKEEEIKDKVEANSTPATKEETPDTETEQKETSEDVVDSSEKEMANGVPANENDNFLETFRNEHKLHSVDFMTIWKHYDKNQSGFIDGSELQQFLKDLLEAKGHPTDKETLDRYEKAMLDQFDLNKDGRIELTELSLILPVENNFLMKFPYTEKRPREQVDEIFAHYDRDGNGRIGGEELLALLRDIFRRESTDITDKELENYADAIKQIYGVGEDGMFSRDDLTLMLSKV